MSSGSAFKASDLRRFEAQGRGTGTFQNYIPWHRVTRTDPSSLGRSHIQQWRGRQRELLSDRELVAFFFSTMHPHVADIREQFPLNQQPGRHELSAYKVGVGGNFAGTEILAQRLTIKHPALREKKSVTQWVMTTDLLLTLKAPDGLSLLAVSVKPAKVWQSPRSKELLSLEKAYWSERSVPWLLLTDEEYEPLIGDLLKGTSAWALEKTESPQLIHWLRTRARNFHGRDLPHILREVSHYCGCSEMAKCAFWQAVWSGAVPFDLRRGWRPSAPFSLLTHESFYALNPVYSRRSAWQP